jgi:uncharacterized protein YlaI
MEHIRRPGFPNEEPEDQGTKSLDELTKETKRAQKATYRPIRLYVTPYERQRVKTPTAEDKERRESLLRKFFEWVANDPDFLTKASEHLRAEVQIHEKIDAAQAQLKPLTPEEFEAQDVEDALNLVGARKTMSGKINLVEKLHPEQLDSLRQRDPDFKAVITGLTKRKARIEKAQNRILDIYRRRGEGGTRP